MSKVSPKSKQKNPEIATKIPTKDGHFVLSLNNARAISGPIPVPIPLAKKNNPKNKENNEKKD